MEINNYLSVIQGHKLLIKANMKKLLKYLCTYVRQHR